MTETARRVRWFRRSDRLDELKEMVARIDTALIVRDPGTARSAEAYEGLRKQVVASAAERRRLVVILTDLAEALRRGEQIDVLSSRAQEWLMQASVVVVDDPSVKEAFEVVGVDDDRSRPAVLSPAYVDTITNSVIRRGVAEYVPVAATNHEHPSEEHR